MLDDKSFQRRRNRRGHPTTQGRIAYRVRTHNPTLPKVKLDLTSDEVLVDRPALRQIGHPYSDQLPSRRRAVLFARRIVRRKAASTRRTLPAA